MDHPISLYPLERTWVIFISVVLPPKKTQPRRQAIPNSNIQVSRKNTLSKLGSFNDVENMWRYFNNIPSVDDLRIGSDIWVFQEGIAPTWEDPSNANGGRWTWRLENTDHDLHNSAWISAYLMIMGEDFGYSLEVNGIILSKKVGYVRISLWTKDKNFRELAQMGLVIKNKLNLPKLEYQDHGAAYDVCRIEL